jgi:hypothetical protein
VHRSPPRAWRAHTGLNLHGYRRGCCPLGYDYGRWSVRLTLADGGCQQAPCAQCVPKFRLLRCSASMLNATAVSPSRCSYQCRGVQSDISYRDARARRWFRAFEAMPTRRGAMIVSSSATSRADQLLMAAYGQSAFDPRVLGKPDGVLRIPAVRLRRQVRAEVLFQAGDAPPDARPSARRDQSLVPWVLVPNGWDHCWRRWLINHEMLL